MDDLDVMSIEARANYEFGVYLKDNADMVRTLNDSMFVDMQKAFVYAYTKGITHFITGGIDD
jgi:hypothetical protein